MTHPTHTDKSEKYAAQYVQLEKPRQESMQV